MSHFLLNRYANASNPNKPKVTAKFMGTGKARGPNDVIGDDAKTRATEIMDKKKYRWRGELLDETPPERVYMVISDISGTPEVGVSNSYVVTQLSNSKITWDRVTQRWVYASYSQKAQPLNATARQVASGWGNGKSRQGGAA